MQKLVTDAPRHIQDRETGTGQVGRDGRALPRAGVPEGDCSHKYIASSSKKLQLNKYIASSNKKEKQ